MTEANGPPADVSRAGDIEPPEALNSRRDHPLDVTGAAHIGGDRHDRRVVLPGEFVSDLLQTIGAAGADHDARPLAPERCGGGPPDPLAPASDDRDLTSQTQFHSLLLYRFRPYIGHAVYDSASRPCGVFQSMTGPSGTIRVGLMCGWVM